MQPEMMAELTHEAERCLRRIIRQNGRTPESVCVVHPDALQTVHYFDGVRLEEHPRAWAFSSGTARRDAEVARDTAREGVLAMAECLERIICASACLADARFEDHESFRGMAPTGQGVLTLKFEVSHADIDWQALDAVLRGKSRMRLVETEGIGAAAPR